MAEKKIVEPAETVEPVETVKPETKTAAAAPAGPEVKSKFPKALLIVLAVIGGLAILGFLLMFGTSIFVGSQIMKNVDVNTSTDGKTVTLGSGDESVTVSDDQKWPDSMPSVVPEFKAGKITASARFGDTWTVTATEVNTADYDAYVAALKTAGYTMDESFDMEGVRTAGGTKAGYRVNITHTTEGTTGSILIGVAKEEAGTAPTE